MSQIRQVQCIIQPHLSKRVQSGPRTRLLSHARVRAGRMLGSALTSV